MLIRNYNNDKIISVLLFIKIKKINILIFFIYILSITFKLLFSLSNKYLIFRISNFNF